MTVVILFVILGAYLVLLRKEEKEEIKKRLRLYFLPPQVLKKNYQDFFFHFTKSNRVVDKNFELYRALPAFSFYKEMIGNYLSLGNSMGISSAIWARSLRVSFSSHFKFWIKFRKKILEIVFQTGIIYLLTYTLAFSITILLPEVEVDLIPIIFWQSLGLICLIFLCFFGHKKKFLGFKECLYSLISFTTLVRIGLPQQRIIELSEINQLKRKTSFNEIHQWLL